MCFEILGFDIIFTDKLKPLLLEVNHAPSFATDSPLDYEVKSNLFIDMFKLLGLSLDSKQAKIIATHEEKMNRLYKKTNKDLRAEKLRLLQEQQKEQDE